MLPQADARTDGSAADSTDVQSLPDRSMSDGPAPDRPSMPDVLSMDSAFDASADVLSMDSGV